MTQRDPSDVVEPDIVQTILQRVIALAPEFNRALAIQIEEEMRNTYGGQRLRIPKRGKFLTPEQREAVFKDGLTDMDNAEILAKHRISLSTLKRAMKRGGRFGG